MRIHLTVIAALLLATPAAAQTTFSLQEENDSHLSGTDRGYTNGTRLLWTWRPAATSRLDRLATRLCGRGSSDCDRIVSAGIGQTMYTPENLAARGRILFDRPYGGWLFGVLMIDATHPKTNDHFEFYAGVIGRDSHAADAQRFVHQHVTPAATDPEGWDNQIGEWAGVLASYERSVTLWPAQDRTSGIRWFDVTPAIGAAAGNVFVNANATATVRLGYNLPRHFIRPIRQAPMALRIDPNLKPVPLHVPRWDAYLFVAANAAYVQRNVFLDAEDETYRIAREPKVREHRMGASVRVGRVRVAYQHTWRSPEFEALLRRPRKAGSHGYDVLLLSFGADP
ncbi:MAG TPA: lipid A deacylase LpxR family protein [Thermoanaerobaculia bacterium]|jgi:hypothetical protein